MFFIIFFYHTNCNNYSIKEMCITITKQPPLQNGDRTNIHSTLRNQYG